MDILETIIKILIGVAIGGSAVFFAMRDKLQQQERSRAHRRLAVLEEVSQHLGKVSHVFGKYASLVTEIGPQKERMSVKQQQELDALSNELVEVYEEVSIAEAKLLMLAEKRLEKAMKIYSSKMAQFRKQFYPGRYTVMEDLSAAKKDIAKMREQFYDVLSDRYDHIMQ
jgi:tRNA U34 5-carboxymethylaminomethyl modifying GTPase MnmE/TrmE